MRELKFRGWSTADKKMYYDVWFDNLEVHWFDVESDEWTVIGDRWPNLMLHQTFVMQFTGLHDKNGEEIYEGDIINFGLGFNDADIYNTGYHQRMGFWSENGFVGQVVSIFQIEKIVFQKAVDDIKYFEYAQRNHPDRLKHYARIKHRYLSEAKDITVIGNIYEHPELIKE